jgi:hypothetical protein
MKRNLAGIILVVVLFVSACGTALLSVKFFFGVKELLAMQGQVLRITSTLNAAQSLANETMEYSRRNPAIDPILQQFEIKSRSGSPAQAQPGLSR